MNSRHNFVSYLLFGARRFNHRYIAVSKIYQVQGKASSLDSAESLYFNMKPGLLSVSL